MRSSRKTTIVLSILGLGLLAALPFLRSSPAQFETARRQPADELSLRGVPLHVSQQSQPSPAVGLYDGDSASSQPVDASSGAAHRHSPDLDQFGPPPDFNSSYPATLDSDDVTGRNRGPLRIRSQPAIRPASAEARLAAGDPPQRHRVIDGDTLSRLARKYLGDSARAREIYDANRDILSTPEILPLGIELVIPAR